MENIMEIEVSKNDDGTIKIWFVAMAGEHGPILNMPRSLALQLNDKLADCLVD